jgi:Ca2+-binding EF-hand superfamily protein
MRRLFVPGLFLLGIFSLVVYGQEPPQGRPGGGGFGGGQMRMQMPTFAELDKNKDKKISRDEFPSALPPQAFDRMDENHDGFIDEEEWNRVRSRFGGGGPRTGESLMKLLDADNDGKVSQSEFAKIVSLFEVLDQNHDGSLSAEELNGFFRAVNEAQTRATGGVNTAGAFEKMDKNKDGKLTPDEADERMFKALDLNKDGVVTRDEFEKAVKEMAERSKARANQQSPPKNQ